MRAPAPRKVRKLRDNLQLLAGFWIIAPGVQSKHFSTSARNALDLGADNLFDQAREIVIEPALQHRPQHFLDEIFQRAGVVRQHGLRQR